MLTGTELGQAIKKAIKLKGATKASVARHFKVTPPSVQDWINHGRIGKGRINALVEYFSDVVGPEHWGLGSYGDVNAGEPGDAGVSELIALYMSVDPEGGGRHRVLAAVKDAVLDERKRSQPSKPGRSKESIEDQLNRRTTGMQTLEPLESGEPFRKAGKEAEEDKTGEKH
jgi:hypothetical protein